MGSSEMGTPVPTSGEDRCPPSAGTWPRCKPTGGNGPCPRSPITRWTLSAVARSSVGGRDGQATLVLCSVNNETAFFLFHLLGEVFWVGRRFCVYGLSPTRGRRSDTPAGVEIWGLGLEPGDVSSPLILQEDKRIRLSLTCKETPFRTGGAFPYAGVRGGGGAEDPGQGTLVPFKW